MARAYRGRCRCVVAAPSKRQATGRDVSRPRARLVLLAGCCGWTNRQFRVPSSSMKPLTWSWPVRRAGRSDALPAPIPKLLLRHGIVTARSPLNVVHELARARVDPRHPLASTPPRPCCSPGRRARLDKPSPRCPPRYALWPAAGCLRGVSTDRVGLAWRSATGGSRRHDRRLPRPGPTESSPATTLPGSITKAGTQTHARRLLVEAACHHRRDTATPSPRCGPGGGSPHPRHSARQPASRLHHVADLRCPAGRSPRRQRRRRSRAGRLVLVPVS